MGFLDSLKSFFSGASSDDPDQWIYVRCQRCDEVIKTRLDLRNDLSMTDDDGYVSNKTLVGNQLCFQRVDVTLVFDSGRRLIDRQINGGEFITAEAFEAASAEDDRS